MSLSIAQQLKAENMSRPGKFHYIFQSDHEAQLTFTALLLWRAWPQSFASPCGEPCPLTSGTWEHNHCQVRHVCCPVFHLRATNQTDLTDLCICYRNVPADGPYASFLTKAIGFEKQTHFLFCMKASLGRPRGLCLPGVLRLDIILDYNQRRKEPPSSTKITQVTPLVDLVWFSCWLSFCALTRASMT